MTPEEKEELLEFRVGMLRDQIAKLKEDIENATKDEAIRLILRRIEQVGGVILLMTKRLPSREHAHIAMYTLSAELLTLTVATGFAQATTLRNVSIFCEEEVRKLGLSLVPYGNEN